MRTRKTLAIFAAAGLLAACEQTPTEPAAEDVQTAVASAFAGSGSAFDDGADRPATLGRLVQTSLRKIRREDGDSAARAAAAQLKPFVEAARAARADRDTAAAHAAMAALRTAEATLVINTLGSGVVAPALGHATARLKAFNDRIAAATGDVTRAKALAASLQTRLDAATAAAAAGDHVAALLGAIDVANVLHMVRTHGPGSRPGRG
jgi:hypothetical protein